MSSILLLMKHCPPDVSVVSISCEHQRCLSLCFCNPSPPKIKKRKKFMEFSLCVVFFCRYPLFFQLKFAFSRDQHPIEVPFPFHLHVLNSRHNLMYVDSSKTCIDWIESVTGRSVMYPAFRTRCQSELQLKEEVYPGLEHKGHKNQNVLVSK